MLPPLSDACAPAPSGGSYFDDGYVDDDEDNGPSFFANLLSGGKLQREYDEKRKKGKQ